MEWAGVLPQGHAGPDRSQKWEGSDAQPWLFSSPSGVGSLCWVWLGAPGGLVLPLSHAAFLQGTLLGLCELKYRILLSMKIQSEGIRYSEKLRRDPKAFLPVAEDWNWVILSSSSNPNHSSTPWKTSPHGYFRRGGLGKVKLSAPILIQDAHTPELGIMCYCTSEPLLPKNELNPRI